MRVPKKLPPYLDPLLAYVVEQGDLSQRLATTVRKSLDNHFDQFASLHATPPKKRKRKSIAERLQAPPNEDEGPNEEEPSDPPEDHLIEEKVKQNLILTGVQQLDQVLKEQERALEQLSSLCANEPAFRNLQECWLSASQMCQALLQAST